MVKGGYQIINFNGVKFTKNTSMQLSNIYDKIEGTNKAILLSGLNVDGVDYRDVMCTPIVIGDSYVIKVFGFRIYISDIDIVSVEDEILFLGDGVDIGTSTGFTLSPYVYNRLRECIKGDLRTIKCLYDGTYVYFNLLSVASTLNSLYFVLFSDFKNIVLQGDNEITIN